jgi:hypothetical protein
MIRSNNVSTPRTITPAPACPRGNFYLFGGDAHRKGARTKTPNATLYGSAWHIHPATSIVAWGADTRTQLRNQMRDDCKASHTGHH